METEWFNSPGVPPILVVFGKLGWLIDRVVKTQPGKNSLVWTSVGVLRRPLMKLVAPLELYMVGLTTVFAGIIDGMKMLWGQMGIFGSLEVV
ncbi:hypothetical protein LAZ67_2003466 [Cordylochernes scorpioides]|uniref:Uncharacterized protein n=1 Tax=Cordylochernes scorpioides TaxID=51811 RepID=A0ABY6K405_9ARAC|nr:hypothetical protein LAZ67_2003466 [Cordylochernes scorpioides]